MSVVSAAHSQDYPQVRSISSRLTVDLFPSPFNSFMFGGKEEIMFFLVPLS